MDDPVNEIEDVIRQLTQTPPTTQRNAILTYFANDAEFTHPFCRTGSFQNSRFLIQAIYRWYKIMSPCIDLDISSVAYDAHNLTLFVNIFQVFSIFIVPFYKAPVELTTVLKLNQASNGKYYITSQNDLYQVNQFVKFFAWPFGAIVVLTWQFSATFTCLVAAVALWPLSWVEDNGPEIQYEDNSDAARVERRLKQTLLTDKENGDEVTQPTKIE